MTADRAYAAPQIDPLANTRLIELQDVYPFSTPNNYLATADGEWVFIGEGGSLAFADFRGIDVNSDPGGMGNLEQSLDALVVKRRRIGSVGVVPASMVLDPLADLSDDDPGGSPGGDDANDLAYVAGGHLGLWVLHMHPGVGYVNEAARIDDSGNLDPLSQNSQRFCTDVRIVTVGDKDYLVALFAKAEWNRIRFYELDQVRALIPGPETGAELSACCQEVINDHPRDPDPQPTNTHGRSLAIAMDVDPYTALNDTPAVDIYVAMNTNGIVRIRATDIDGSGLAVSRKWGPIFGDNSIHVDDDASTPAGQNSSGLPVERYTNVEWRDMDRHDGAGEITRDDPPAFVDVAVQDDGAGAHYLYAAVDSLGWVRFDLEDTFEHSMEIDYHEGEQMDVHDFTYGDVQVTWQQPFMRPLDFPGTTGEDLQFCRNVEIVQVEDPNGQMRSVLLALYSGAPWAFVAQNVGPGVTFDQDFAKVSDICFFATQVLSTGGHVLTIHETDDIPDPGGMSFAGYIQVGGGDLFVPAIQTEANNGAKNVLRFVHGVWTGDLASGMTTETPHKSCVSFFDLTPPVTQGSPVSEPYYLREPQNAPGRYHFGAVPSLADPFLLVTAHNDSANVQQGVLEIVPTVDPNGPDDYVLQPLDGDLERQFDSGILCEPEAQWTDQTSNGDVLITMGRASTAEWRIAEDSYTLSPTADVTAERRWTLPQPLDRWRRTSNGDYFGAATDPDYDAYTSALRPVHPNQDVVDDGPDTWVVTYHLRSCDGIQFIGRDRSAMIEMMMDVAFSLTSGGVIPLRDPRTSAFGHNPWWIFQLDVDPSFSNFPDEEGMTDYVHGKNWWTASPQPYTLWPSARRCFSPEFFPLKSSAQGARDTWVLAAACGHASCPPEVSRYSNDANGNLTPDSLDLAYLPSSFDPDPLWADKHDHGFCLVWDVSDPWQLALDAETGLPLDQQRPIRTDRDPLIFPDEGGTAFRLDHVHVPQHDKDLLFVADMAGHVHCFDVTDLMYTQDAQGLRSPIATWTAPDSMMDERPNNVRALAVDLLSSGTVMCYIGVSRVGLYSVPFTNASSFATGEQFKVKTPGEVWGLAITGSGEDRVLVVSDAWAGMRLYGMADLPGTGE